MKKKHLLHHKGANVMSYTLGFGLSIILTSFSFLLAPHFGSLAAAAIVLSALAQLVTQLVFFLHIGRGKDAYANVGMLMFALTIIGILIVGTLWIMNNLAHLHLHSPTPNDLYVQGIVAPQNELR